MIKKLLILLSVVGIIDSSYLTYEYYSHRIPPCTTAVFADCGKVLSSQFASIYGVPISLLGVIYYCILLGITLVVLFRVNIWVLKCLLAVSAIGFLISLYLVYLQIIVIGAICVYCMVSAINSVLIFGVSVYLWKKKK